MIHRLWGSDKILRNQTMNQYDLLLKAVETSDVQQIRELATSGLDMNNPCDDGASVLFSAILIANVEVIRTLLELGADPNFRAVEPALTVYADTPLDVALQARVVMDWEKYNPIVHVLIDYGAIGPTFESGQEALIRQRALDWQQNGKQWET